MVSAVTYDIDSVISQIQSGENVESTYVPPELDLPEPKNLPIPEVTVFKDVPRAPRQAEEEAYEPARTSTKPLPKPAKIMTNTRIISATPAARSPAIFLFSRR